jgi:hypothetical protein
VPKKYDEAEKSPLSPTYTVGAEVYISNREKIKRKKKGLRKINFPAGHKKEYILINQRK